MSFKESSSGIFRAGIFLLWTTLILAAFYITQRPLVFQVWSGIVSTLWAILLTTILLVSSAGIGSWMLEKLHVQTSARERLILGAGIGLGVLGLGGYALGAAGWSHPVILSLTLSVVFGCVVLTRVGRALWNDIRSMRVAERPTDDAQGPAWIAPAVILTVLLAFLFALLPPAEGFDGLTYHLTLPERLLADRQILPHDIIQFWFPSLIEGDFLWAVGLGSERTAQLIHWSFLILLLALTFEWTSGLSGRSAGWWALAVLISMPSLPWISAWAYTDMALAFVDLACLYSLWRWVESRDEQWMIVGGCFAGMAMGIKYTSFILPVLCLAFIPFFERDNQKRFRAMFRFLIPAVLIACPWYLRNALIMGNPVYPFIFGGRYWDAFRAASLNSRGTGIGWDVKELSLLPLTITLGYRDRNYFDGRMGPLFLVLAPLAFWIIWKHAGRLKSALTVVIAFAALNYLIWTLGVIESMHLWQARLLWPGLIPLAIPIGLGLIHMKKLDLPRLRTSFIITCMIGLVIGATLFDNSLSLIFRRPLAYALGMESREMYFKRIQPQYAYALDLVNSTPSDAQVYFLFEPRSYNMSRSVAPDPLNDHLGHDLHIHETAEDVLKDWRGRGYTHVLVNTRHLQPFIESAPPELSGEVELLFNSLVPVDEQGNYRLYLVPD